MKKLLQFSMLFFAEFCLAQAPTVTTPTQVSVTQSTATISTNVGTNSNTLINVLISGLPTFSDPLTVRTIANVGNVTGTQASTPFSYTISCLYPGQTYYVKVVATNSSGTTTSDYSGVITQPFGISAGGCSVGLITSTLTSATIPVQYTFPNGTTNQSLYIYYGATQNNTNFGAIIDPPFVSGTLTATSRTITGLQPSTVYYAYVEVGYSGSNGAICFRTDYFSFSTAATGTLLYHFPFDGDRSSIVNSGTFTSTTNPVFVDNGLGNGTGALEVSVNSTNYLTNSHTGNLPLLPQGNTSRSIAMRVNFKTLAMHHYVVSWGTPLATQSYGFEKLQASGASSIWGDLRPVADQTQIDTWINFVITYNAFDGRANYYKNGAYVGGQNHYNQQTVVTNTTGTNIVLGTSLAANFGTSNFLIDDLKIYSGALTATQIQSLSSKDFQANNLKFSMSPNPANNILNIDMEKEVQSVEIYSLQGQKVFFGNDKTIDITNLSSGMYMVRVQDVDGGIATQKLMKN